MDETVRRRHRRPGRRRAGHPRNPDHRRGRRVGIGRRASIPPATRASSPGATTRSATPPAAWRGSSSASCRPRRTRCSTGCRRTKGDPDAEEALPDADDHQAGYRSMVATELVAAADAGARFFPEASGETGDIAVDDLAGEFAAELVAPAAGPAGRGLRRRRRRGTRSADRIRSCYREWKTERIADTAGALRARRVRPGRGRGGSRRSTAFRWVVDDGEHPVPRLRRRRPRRGGPQGRAVPHRRPAPAGPPGLPVPDRPGRRVRILTPVAAGRPAQARPRSQGGR